MRKILYVLLFFISSISFSQNKELLEGKYQHFALHTAQDTIDFIVVDSVLNRKKPLFLFCQGSLPYPLFFQGEIGSEPYFFGGGLSNFDLKTIQKNYHVVVLSMPKTPLYVAHVAVKLARTNKHVTCLGLFGFDPFGRYEKLVRQIRKDAMQQKNNAEGSRFVDAGAIHVCGRG